ncbi:uncharacterized protein LOC107820481 [Nicotiana tabacum]|uniref:Avr9/Cf-9 rapidly elicited protein 75 n=1 Tax=Nicotiana tabacum TaxID=4097 RepID=Q9FQY9_TOBAC|nr:uncharacterized protein LOC104084449 [Nicotiana tomentosiformis]XP_016502257.1 PREDICTED: uncharacterized protein LOC107820481 [Nicotiana tabacum]AAG43558.1 Avr9/Cf-9 rapidly elicited protein 75 [Nicotiana tabacum]
MAFSEPEVICKKHPQHKQQPGVCSCCLREKLSKINGTSTIMAALASISSSLSSSTTSSNCVSPRGAIGHRRITSDVTSGHYSFVTLAGGGAGGGLKKSRSIAIVARGGRVGINGKKKKEGFWSKLIKSTGKRTKRVIAH